MAAPCTPAPIRRPRRGAADDPGANLRDRHTGDGRRPLGGDRAAIEDRGGHAGPASLSDDEPVDRRAARRRSSRSPRPTSCPRGRRRRRSPRRCAGIAWDERVLGARMDGDLGWELGTGERARSSSARRARAAPRAAASRRARRRPSQRSGGPEPPSRRTSGARVVAPRSHGYDARWPPIDRRRAWRTSSSSATRSRCTTRWPASRRTPPRRGLPDDRRQRAPPRRRLGRQAAGARRRRPRADRPADPRPDDRADRAPLRDPCGPRPGPGARGRRGGPLRAPRARPRSRRSPRTSASTPRSGSASAPQGRRGGAGRAAARTSPRARAGIAPAGRGRCARSSSASRTGSSPISPS